jgi:hypothetical protein
MMEVYADWETYYDQDYSLSNMSPAEYILDPRFEMLGCGICIDDDPPRFLKREESINFFRKINEPYAMISHNALFDAVILALKYDIHPDVLIDTMGMVRALIQYKIPSGRVSLKAVLDFLGFEAKGDTVRDMKGIHFDDIKNVPDLWMRFVAYTLRDVRGCREIFKTLAPSFPPQEARIMDTVIRMATQPRLLTDEYNLQIHLFDIEKKKNELLKVGGLDASVYRSNDKFANVLRSLGVEPPMKVSPTTGKPAYAFAKSDADFMELLDHEDERVQNAIETRLALKTSIEQTRAQRFMCIAAASKRTFDRTWMPVPLKYGGAHTHRLSGDWALNMQNLSNRKNNRLRAALYAPPGYIIVAIDAAQIEARLTAWLAGQHDLLQSFAAGVDIYREFASDIYHKTISQISKLERFNAKTCVLGLGFGMSDRKLLLTIRNKAREDGFDVEYTLEQCTEWVNKYRARFEMIRQLWSRCNNLLGRMERGKADGEMIGPCVVDQSSIILPSGLRLNYRELTETDDGFTYKYGAMTRKIYGAKMVENVVQALDRQHVLEAALRTEDRCERAGLSGIRIAMQIHDENGYVLSDEIAKFVAKVAYEEMCRPAKWASGLPLAAEVKAGQTYGELREWRYE